MLQFVINARDLQSIVQMEEFFTLLLIRHEGSLITTTENSKTAVCNNLCSWGLVQAEKQIEEETISFKLTLSGLTTAIQFSKTSVGEFT